MGPLCKCIGKTIVSNLVSYITGTLHEKLFSIALNLLFPMLGTAINIFAKIVLIIQAIHEAANTTGSNSWYKWGVVVGQLFNLILDVITGGRYKMYRLK